MFNFGWGELVVIGIVALIAIGPKELPTVLRMIGQWTGKIRRMANEFQGQFQEALREAELGDLKKHAEDLTSEVASIANIDPLAEEQKTDRAHRRRRRQSAERCGDDGAHRDYCGAGRRAARHFRAAAAIAAAAEREGFRRRSRAGEARGQSRRPRRRQAAPSASRKAGPRGGA